MTMLSHSSWPFAGIYMLLWTVTWVTLATQQVVTHKRLEEVTTLVGASVYLCGQMEERAYISWTVVCCLLDVCGLWLCLPPISVFGVVHMPTGPTVNAPYRLATPEGTSAAENPWEDGGWMSCVHCGGGGGWGKVSVQACHLTYIKHACDNTVY